jgi:hypothetical protein
MNRRRLVIGVAIILVASSPELYVQYRLRAHHWDPLQRPILIKTGRIESPEFLTDLDGTYVVSLVFLPKDVQREECLVGDSLFKASCASLGSGLNLDWSVVRRGWGDDLPVVNPKAYKPAWFSGAGSIEAALGTFEAERGKKYSIVLEVHQNSPELNAASPSLKVEAHRIYWEKWVIFNQMAILLASVVGLIGLFVAIWGALS